MRITDSENAGFSLGVADEIVGTKVIGGSRLFTQKGKLIQTSGRLHPSCPLINSY